MKWIVGVFRSGAMVKMPAAVRAYKEGEVPSLYFSPDINLGYSAKAVFLLENDAAFLKERDIVDLSYLSVDEQRSKINQLAQEASTYSDLTELEKTHQETVEAYVSTAHEKNLYRKKLQKLTDGLEALLKELKEE